MDDPVKEIGKDIVKSFHEQFAQNQNHHQGLFLQTLTILLTVLIGYGYLFVRINAESKEVKVTIETLNAYFSVSMFLLSIAIALISNMALGFRRDQLLASNIRVKTGVMTVGSNDNYFSGTFNPCGKTNFFTWMPEFHMIFYCGLVVVKLLLFAITIKYPKDGWLIGPQPFFVFLGLCSFGLDIFVALRYWIKWRGYSKNAPEILQPLPREKSPASKKEIMQRMKSRLCKRWCQDGK